MNLERQLADYGQHLRQVIAHLEVPVKAGVAVRPVEPAAAPVGGRSDMEKTATWVTGRRGLLIAAAALAAALVIALPLWFVFRGDETAPVVTEPTVVTTTMLGSTTTIPAAATTTTTTAESATTTTVPVAVAELGSPDRLSDFQAKPLPPAATCPPGSTPDVPGGDTWWWNRPSGEALSAAFDRESERLVLVGGRWVFDPCRNVWEEGSGDRWSDFVVYDADSDLVIAFGNDGGVGAYDADADTWTEKGGMPGTSDWSFQAVYHDPSGLVVGVSGFGSARHFWAYDVDSDTWYDLGPANLGVGLVGYDPVMLGYDPVGDRFYAYVSGDGGEAQTWRYEPGQGWTQLGILTPDFDFYLSKTNYAYPAGMAFDRSTGRFVIVDQGVVAALNPSVPEWEIIFDQSEGPGPLNRSFQTVVYDPLNGRLIVLGGQDGAGEWASDVWAFDTRSREWSDLLPPIVAWAGIVSDPSISGDAARWYSALAVSASEVWATGDPRGADIGHLDDGVWTSYRLADDGHVGGLAVAPDGTVWAVTSLGVFSFDGVEWTLRFDHPAYEVAVTQGGTVWISLYGWWLARWDGTTFLPVNPNAGEPHAQGVWDVAYAPRLTVAADGRVWGTQEVGWSGYGLMRYDGATLEDIPIADYPAEDIWLWDMAAAPNGDLWITGTIQADPGLLPLTARFDGEAWTTYDLSPSDLAVGPDGVAWFATDDGLQSFDGTEWVYRIQGQEVWGVDVAPDGTVWYTDEDGFHTLGN